MSHSKEDVVCPNCGFHATANYCAECGQENHLHQETFWGLVMHFVGHYFHYDSKFWQTIKALWFSPGKLTVAYMQKQRMRYIQPVSLYIFISAVFFLLSLVTDNNWVIVNDKKAAQTETQTKRPNLYTISSKKGDSSTVNRFIDNKVAKIQEKYGDTGTFMNEKINHNLPKIFFFMIPVMALILKLLFFRRKDVFFVDHAIFSLHYHSFWFSLFIITEFPLPMLIKNILMPVLIVVAGYYMIAALHTVYQINWWKSILKSVVLGISYTLLLVVIFLSSLLLIIACV